MAYYLDSLVEKLGGILASIHDPPNHYLVYLRAMFGDSKKWYNRTITGPTAINEEMFSVADLTEGKKASVAESEMCEICVGIPDGNDCPDFETVWDRAVDTSDWSDIFYNWEGAAA